MAVALQVFLEVVGPIDNLPGRHAAKSWLEDVDHRCISHMAIPLSVPPIRSGLDDTLLAHSVRVKDRHDVCPFLLVPIPAIVKAAS